MLQRFLFIGVGGSGGATLRHIRRDLLDRLEKVDYDGFPEGWQFLHLDTPTQADSEPRGLPPLPRESYRSLVRPGVSYQTIWQSLTRDRRTWESCGSWLPDRNQVNVPIQEGAGQFRAVGRAVAIGSLAPMADAIKRKADRLDSNEARTDMLRLSEALGGSAAAEGEGRSPAAVVVSSLAGGTGSGMFLDACTILRYLPADWASNSTAVLYAPDVFGSLPDNKRQGVSANALSTLSELLAGYWNTEAEDDPLLGTVGLVPAEPQTRRGPARAFLVGATNGDRVSFRDAGDVYAAMGRTLAAWATNERMQEEFGTYLAGNWDQNGKRPDPLRLAGNLEIASPFAALGYASIGLGRHLFRQYATECLTRQAARRLRSGRAGHGGDLDDQERVELIRRRMDTFLAAARLMMPTDDPDRSQVLDDLSPGPELLEEARRDIVEEFGTTPAELANWRRMIVRAVENRRERFLENQRTRMWERIDEWTHAVQDRILAAVQDEIVVDGLSVTEGLLDGAIRRLETEDIPRLGTLAGEYRREAAGFDTAVGDALSDNDNGSRFLRMRRRPLYTIDRQPVGVALSRGLHTGLKRPQDAELRSRAQEVLTDLVENFLRPLRATVHNAVTALERNFRAAPGTAPLIRQWPDAPAYLVPDRLQPTPTQLLLDPQDEYPAKFRSLLVESTPRTQGDEGVATAVDLLLKDADTGPLLTVTARWRPRLQDRLDEQRAAFGLRTSLEELQERTRSWVVRPGTAIGRYVSETLKESLEAAPHSPETQERLARFREKFTEALRTAAPLVEINEMARTGTTGGQAQQNRPMTTPIPFSRGTAAYEFIQRELSVTTGLTHEELAPMYFGDSDSAEIEIITFLGSPLHPVAFESLTRPMLQDWTAKKNDEVRRGGFSRWRRAMPLPKALPIVPESRRAMVRGWFTADLTGRLQVQPGDQVRIWSVDRYTWVPFPDPLLGATPAPGDPFDAMAAVLESLPLTLLGYGRSDDVAEGYQQLLALGRSGRQIEIDGGGYSTSNPALSDWLRGGRSVPTLSGESAADRTGAAVEYIETLEKNLAARVADMAVPGPRPRVDRVWELRDDLRSALAELGTVIRGDR